MAAICFIILSTLLFHPVFLLAFPWEDCPMTSCGKHGQIRYPFTNTTNPGECGPFVVGGCDQGIQKVQLRTEPEKWYDIQSVSRTQSSFITEISLTDKDLQQNLYSKNCESLYNLIPPIGPYTHPFIVDIASNFIAFYKCSRSVDSAGLGSNFRSYKDCPDFNLYYNTSNVNASSLPNLTPRPPCSIFHLPVRTNYSLDDDIFGILTANFSFRLRLEPNCHYNSSGLDCAPRFPPPQSHTGSNTVAGPPPKEHKGWRSKLGIGIGCSAVLLIILVVLFFVWHRHFTENPSSKIFPPNISSHLFLKSERESRKFTSNNLFFCWMKKAKDSKTIDAFLKNHGPMPLKRYKYTEVKKMTECFKDKLGKGGYGGVFKGKLPDGRSVAVKVLKESKSNGEEFVNEVASISRTSHVNVVTLLGFCYEGSKRALIYEFMSSGSLEKYIYDENSFGANRRLGWQTLYEIAIGIALGLEYLHRGCNTRILHFDIKPHNILLDEKFCPKISDFGLAKICPTRESIISMMGARGTFGYIAPEVFCRNFGGVSHKSDVYSYGMLVLEMAGGRKNVCVEVDNSNEIYFPDWIYKRLEVGEELGLHGIDNEEENQMARKMMLVSLWCIQTNPANRPPMGRVVEMLQGSLVSLQMPPRPYLSSPSRSLPQPVENSSTTTSFIV